MSLTLPPVNFTHPTCPSYPAVSLPALSTSSAAQPRNYTVIDPTIPGNRLYETENGEVVLVPKTPGEIAGEKLIRPLLEKVSSLAPLVIVKTLVGKVLATPSFIYGLVENAYTRLDKALSFPVAAASEATMSDELNHALAKWYITKSAQRELLKEEIDLVIDELVVTKKEIEMHIKPTPQNAALRETLKNLKTSAWVNAYSDWSLQRSIERDEVMFDPYIDYRKEVADRIRQHSEPVDKIYSGLIDAIDLMKSRPFVQLELATEEQLHFNLQQVEATLKNVRDLKKSELFSEPVLQTVKTSPVPMSRPKDSL